MDRFGSGDLAQFKREQERQCRQSVAAYAHEQQRQRDAYADAQRRAERDRQESDRQQQASRYEQNRQQQTALDQQRRTAQERQQAQERERLAAQQRAARNTEQQRSAMATLAGALGGNRAQTAALPDDDPPPTTFTPVAGSSRPAASETRAAMQDLGSINRQESGAPPGTPPAADKAERIRSAFDNAKTSYDTLMDSNVTVGGTPMNVGELTDTLVSMAVTLMAEVEVKSLLTAVLGGTGRVLDNPFVDMSKVFLDPEFGRNIMLSVDAARRQAATGTMNENRAREMRGVMEELERQRGQ
jgi:hypothetical protein